MRRLLAHFCVLLTTFHAPNLNSLPVPADALRDLSAEESAPKQTGLEQALAGAEERFSRKAVLPLDRVGQIEEYLDTLYRRGTDPLFSLMSWGQDAKDWRKLQKGQRKEIVRWMSLHLEQVDLNAGQKDSLADFFEKVSADPGEWLLTRTMAATALSFSGEGPNHLSRVIKVVETLWKELGAPEVAGIRGAVLQFARQDLYRTLERLNSEPLAKEWLTSSDVLAWVTQPDTLKWLRWGRRSENKVELASNLSFDTAQAVRALKGLFEKNPAVWSAVLSKDERDKISEELGWVDAPQRYLGRILKMKALAEELKSEGIKKVVVLGGGASFWGAGMLGQKLSDQPGYPRLLMLDLPEEEEIAWLERQIGGDWASTVFIVST